MKKVARLGILLVSLAVILWATGLHRRLNEPVVHGSVVGLVLGFMAGRPKRAVMSGIFWRVIMPLYQVAVEKASINILDIYKSALIDVQTTAMVLFFSVVGSMLKEATD